MSRYIERKYDEAFEGWTQDDIRHFGLRALYRTLTDSRFIEITRPTRRSPKKKKGGRHASPVQEV